MEKVVLGRTGLEVPRLSLGGLFVSKVGAEFDDGKAAVLRALEQGINYIDTAPTYANSEEVLGKILKDVNDEVILSTKLGGGMDDFNPQSKDCLQASFEKSLRLLEREKIDILMVHEPERPGAYDWWTDFLNVDGPVLEFCQELKEKGLVDHIGVGGTTAYEMAHLLNSGKFDVVLTAFQFNIMNREAVSSVFPAAKAHDTGVVIGSPLHQGTYSMKFDAIYDDNVYWLNPIRRQQFKDLYALADDCGLSVPQLAMRFAIFHDGVHTVLTGSRSVKEVDLNLAAFEAGPLSDDILDRLTKLADRIPFRPAEEGTCLGWRLRAPESYKGPQAVQ